MYLVMSNGELSYKVEKENYFFLVTSEGTVSHNLLYYQSLPITRYQVRFYAYSYSE